jgi:hypothetical protein
MLAGIQLPATFDIVFIPHTVAPPVPLQNDTSPIRIFNAVFSREQAQKSAQVAADTI